MENNKKVTYYSAWTFIPLITFSLFYWFSSDWEIGTLVRLGCGYLVGAFFTTAALSVYSFENDGKYLDGKELLLGLAWPVYFVLYFPKWLKLITKSDKSN